MSFGFTCYLPEILIIAQIIACKPFFYNRLYVQLRTVDPKVEGSSPFVLVNVNPYKSKTYRDFFMD